MITPLTIKFYYENASICLVDTYLRKFLDREMILICTSCYMRKTFINNVQWNNFLRCVFKGCNLAATKYWVYTILHKGCLVFLHNDCLNICYGSKNSLTNYYLKNDLPAQAFHICGISIAQLFCRAVINALDVKSSLDLI